MKQIEVTDEVHARLMALCARLEWDVDKTLLQIIEDAEDLQSDIEAGQTFELDRLLWRGK